VYFRSQEELPNNSGRVCDSSSPHSNQQLSLVTLITLQSDPKLSGRQAQLYEFFINFATYQDVLGRWRMQSFSKQLRLAEPKPFLEQNFCGEWLAAIGHLF
jgi:hypothetical protein